MKRLDISHATAAMGEYVRTIGDEPIAIMDGDDVLAVLVATPNSDWESVSLSLSPTFADIITRARRSRDRMSIENFMAELGITRAEVESPGEEADPERSTRS